MKKILITGGIKSGKSSFALKLCHNFSKKLFIATAEAFDDDMKKKIKRHQEERKKENFDLIEEPIDIISNIKINHDKYEVILIDCLTMWVNNLLYYKKDFNKYMNNFANILNNINTNIVIVTNEVGWGIIPPDQLTNQFINNLGNLNKIVANICNEVFLNVSGISIKIKQK